MAAKGLSFGYDHGEKVMVENNPHMAVTSFSWTRVTITGLIPALSCLDPSFLEEEPVAPQQEQD